MNKQYFERSFFLLGFLGLLLISQSGFAQSSETENKKIKVMVLGTFHFHHSPDYYNIISSEKQKEIKAVINSLAEFRPSKIALEASYKDSAKFDSLYKKYRAGKHKLNTNERQQLGFRLADRFEHNTVYAVDYKLRWPYGKVMGWAEEHAPAFMEFYNQWRNKRDQLTESMYKEATIAEHLRWLNNDESRELITEVRMRRMELGGTSNFVGVETLSSSYERNLKIFSNIMHYAETGDRIIVIFGSGHNYFLKEFVQMHPDTELAKTLDYL